jgi:tetratricopeptide (TPR) repeat protein
MKPSKKHPSRRLRAYAGPRSVFAEVSFREFYFEDQSLKIFSKLNARMPSGQLFEMGFFEAILKDRPEYLAVLEALGQLYTELGQYEKGMAIDKRIVRLKPGSAVARYNLACSYSLLEIPGKALEELRRAVELGYSDWEHLENDEDLANLRSDERYRSLISEFRASEPA